MVLSCRHYTLGFSRNLLDCYVDGETKSSVLVFTRQQSTYSSQSLSGKTSDDIGCELV